MNENNTKRIEDYINIQTDQTPEQLIQDFKTELSLWSNLMKELQEKVFETHFNSSAKDVQEVMDGRRFISQYIEQRIEEISHMDEGVKKRFLQVIPPFHTSGGVAGLLGHFFELQINRKEETIEYRKKTDDEKELSILLDMYKLKKTLDTIITLEKEVRKSDSFPSFLSRKDQIECLSTLKTVFKVLFQRCIQPEYQQELYKTISKKHLSAEALLKRREEGKHLVYPHVIKKFDYRIQFFLVYFKEGLKAKIRGEVKEFRYNYLEFELLKQEFLVHWLEKNLQNNPKKIEIYNKYKIDGQNMAEIVRSNPEKEREIMLRLPIEIFNDIAEEVSQTVAKENRSGVSTESEKHGEYAETLNTFHKAKEAAKLSLEKLKLFVTGKKSTPEEKKLETKVSSEEIIQKNVEEEDTVIEEPIITLLKKNECDYPYFQREVTKYPQQLALLRVKMGNKFGEFNKKVVKKLSSTNESALIQRRTPKHEWVLPYQIETYVGDKVKKELLVIGAEVKAKQLGMGYSGNVNQQYTYTPYFLFASNEKNENYGKSKDKRKIRNEELSLWDFTQPSVQERVLTLINMIIQN